MTLGKFLILVASALWCAGMVTAARAAARHREEEQDRLNAAWERNRGDRDAA